MLVAKRARSGFAWLAAFLAGLSSGARAQPAQPKKASARSAGVTAPSHVFPRGDREILTFESEDEYDSLEDAFRKQADTRPEPGTMTRLFLRSRTDGSVQPYAIRLPRDPQGGTTYPLVVQLHGTNFMEVLSGARGRYQGMGGPQWIEPDLRVIYVS